MAEQDPVKYFKSEIKRLNYYNSQFLVDTDFNDEQLYHKQMRRLHNRALHTWGVVEGLQVERVPNESKVTVAPGVAIDRLGQEIVLPERSAAIGFDKYDAGAQVYVTLSYADVADPADKDTGNKQFAGEHFKRWTERPVVKESADAPAADTPDVLLAVVKLDSNKSIEDVLPSKRRYAGSRIGSSADGKEFGIYADAAGAWHFFDGGKNADRLTVDDKGTLKITGGDLQLDAGREILFKDGGQIRSRDDNHRILFRRDENKLELREFGDIIFSPGANGGAETAKVVMAGGGNVGVGTATPPSQKLHVNGMIYSETGGFKFPDGTTQTTAAGSAKIPAENVAAGSFGANTGGGAYTFPAALYWGNSAARTETKDDAGAIASRSGFFETSAPVNYYAGASSWQHLIEARHSNGANNYALQIAGSFFDQSLYMRKTNNDPAARWSRFVLMNSDGYVGVGTEKPLGPLSVGDSSVAGSDGYIVLGKKTPAGGTRHFRLGFDADFNFTIGDYGNNNNAGTWTSPFAMFWQAPSKSLYIDSAGSVGLGTAKPRAKLDVADTATSKTKSILARLPEGNDTGDGTYLGVKSYETQPGNCKLFAIEHAFYGSINSAINFYRGGNVQGGYIGFATNKGEERMTLDPYGNLKVSGAVTIGTRTLYGEGDHLYFSHGGRNVLRLSVTWDRLQIYKNLDSKAPYFFYNQDGGFNNYKG